MDICSAEIQIQNVLGNLNLAEFKNCAITLGLRNSDFDLLWETAKANLNAGLQTGTVDLNIVSILFSMIERERENLRMVRNATYIIMSSILEEKDHAEMMKRKKLETNRSKARERAQKKKAVDIDSLLNQFATDNGLVE